MKREFNYWQNRTFFHPFTCENNCGNLKYRKNDMICCEICGYEQKLSDSHKRLLKENFKSHKIKASLYFKWFDFWIGWFYDKNKNVLYIGFLPMLGLKVEF